MERAYLQKTAILLVSLLSLSSASAAKGVAPLQSLSQLSSEDLASSIVRIDYRGPQDKPLSPVVFTIKGIPIDRKLVSTLQSLDDLSSGDLSNAVVRIAYLGDASETPPPIVFATKGTEVDQKSVTALQSVDDLSPADLSTAVVGLQVLGSQRGLLLPMVFTIRGRELDWKRLRAVPELEIGDSVSTHTKWFFTVTVEDMKRFIEVAKTVVIPTQEAEAWLSLVVVAGSEPHQKVFHGWVLRQKAGEFFILMRNTLRADPKDISIMNGGANYEAMNVLQSFGCALGLLPQVIPAKDVTNAVAVTRGGLRFNYQERRFETTVTLKNISNEPIRAPISLVVDLSSGNIHVANAHARTCVTQPAGRAFLTLPLPTEVFKPGQILETVLVFTGTEGEDIAFTTKVLATPGER
jgi:hypothetical protein